MYRLMVIARAVDERMWILNRAGKIPFVISGQGHEGAQVGLAFALQQGHDWMVPYYRSVASLMTFGMSPREIMLAQFARGVDPSSGGRQMPGHYGIKDRNILSVSSPVATQILHATGIAWAAKLRKQDVVTITYLGEGSSNQGDFHEALNFAGIHKLPIVYVVENNGWAISVPDVAPVGRAGHRHPRRGLQHARRHRRRRRRAELLRRGPRRDRSRAQRPGSDADRGEGDSTDRALVGRPADEVPRRADEMESEKARDPLPRFRDQLREAGMLDEETEAAMTAESRKVVEDATEWAEAQAEPDPATAQQNVYATEPPARMDDPLWNGDAVHRRRRPVGRAERRRGGGLAVAVMTMIESVRSTLAEEMRRDEAIVVLGEDVGKKGGVFLATDGLYDEFGGDRVLDTPLTRIDDRGRLDRRRGRRPATRARDPVRGLHLPGDQPDPVRGGAHALPLERRLLVPHDAPRAIWRWRPRRAVSLAVGRGVLRPHPRPEGRDSVDAPRRARSVAHRRSATTIPCSSSSTRRCTDRCAATCPTPITRSRSARRT